MGNHKIHEEVILEGRKLTKVFGTGKKAVAAVNGVDFAFHKGEIISIVGESGSGKTTLMNMLMGLSTPTSGEIWFQGKRLQFHKGAERKSYWKSVQAIFQDPFSSFNQFFRIERIFMDGLSFSGRHVTGKEAQFQIAEACRFVNLEYASLEGKYPFELSGGQMQRLVIARIFLMKPQILIADEPTSMIDACSRSTILEMLMKLCEENGMTVIFITHDLGLAYYISDRICIMQKGEFVEVGKAEQVIQSPQEPYTRHLLADVPKLNEKWLAVEGSR